MNGSVQRLPGRRLPRRRMLLLLALLSIAATGAGAQNVNFSGSAKQQVQLGEQFQVTYTLSGGNLKQYRDFRQTNLNTNFLTLMGPSTSQSVSIINGQMSSSISWTYVLQPRNLGTYTIPPATIVYDGAQIKSNPLTIKVVNAAPGTKPDPKSGGAAPDAQNVNLGDNLFVRAIVDKRSAYVGEPIFVTYKIYSRVAFRLENPSKFPRMIGFWSEDIEAPTQLQRESEMYNGKQYETFVLRKVALFPTQAGELSIDPFEIQCLVQVRQRRKSGDDFFDKFFSDPFFDDYKNVKKTLETEKIAITAKPLPEQGRPLNFGGAAGEFTMQASIDKRSVKANDPVTLTVTLRGEGNIKLIEEPYVDFPSNVDHYDPKIDEEIIRSQGRISGVKKFEYILVPRYAGKIDIPPVTFSYFNLADKKYKTLISEPFALDVSEGEGDRSASIARQDRVGYLTRDIHPLKPLDGRVVGETSGPSTALLIGMYLLPFAALAGGLVTKRRYDRVRGDVVGMKMRRATRMAEKHLSQSRKYLDANNIDAYYLEVARALWGYTQNRLNLPTAEVSIENVIGILNERGASDIAQARLRDALDATEYARFSPTRTSAAEMRGLYEQAKLAIISVEQSLKG
jgi:hypothetical protein